MKKGLLGLIIPLGVIFTLLLPVGVVALMLFDPTKSNFQPENITTEQVFQRQLVRSFKDISTTGKMEFKVNQDTLNQVLYNAMGDVKKQVAEPYASMLGDLYVEINNKDYNFYLPVNAFGFQSRAKVFTVLSGDEDNSTEYVFTIKGANLGNFPAWDIIKMTGVLNSLDLNSTFQNAGLRIKSDLPNGRLTYNKHDMMEDLTKMMSNTSGEQGDLLSGALEMMDISFNFNNGINGIGDFNAMKDNADKIDSASRLSSLNDAHNNIITPAVTKATEAIKNGTPEQEALDTLKNDFSALKTAYGENKDINSLVSDRLSKFNYVDYLTDAIYGTGGQFKNVSHVDENEISSVLKSTGLLGTTFTFNYKDEVAYAVIDQFFTDVFVRDGQSYLNFALGVNLNGFETRAIIETKVTFAQDAFVAELDFSGGIYYGTKAAPQVFETAVKTYMDKAIDDLISGGGWDSLSHEHGSTKIKIDFDSMLKKNFKTNTYLTIFDAFGERRINVENEGSSDVAGNGKLAVQFRAEPFDINKITDDQISSLVALYLSGGISQKQLDALQGLYTWLVDNGYLS